MIGRLAEKLAGAMVSSGVVSESDRDVYVYGLDVLLATAASVVCILALGLLLGHLPETLVFMAFFIVLRSAAGGFHASTHFRCFLVMLAAYAAAMAILAVIPDPILKWPALPVAVVALAAVAVLAPAPHQNRPVSPAELRNFRRLSLLIALAEALCTGLGVAFGAGNLAMAGALGMMSSAASLAAARWRSATQ